MSDRIREEFWGHQFDDLFQQIVREATICKVRLLDPGVVEADALIQAIREKIQDRYGGALRGSMGGSAA